MNWARKARWIGSRRLPVRAASRVHLENPQIDADLNPGLPVLALDHAGIDGAGLVRPLFEEF